MKILSVDQIRAADAATIENEPISSLNLMERAASQFTTWFCEQFPRTQHDLVSIIVGKGNNGGDGLVAARLLEQKGYDVEVFVLDLFPSESPDFTANLQRLQAETKVRLQWIQAASEMPVFDEREVLVDAILGSGLTRVLDGELEAIVSFINECTNIVVSMDIPSGMFADIITHGVSIHADYTYSFETPYLGFMFPDNFERVGEFFYGSIGLDRRFMAELRTDNFYVTESTIKNIYIKRSKYAHKGLFGHALLIMGSHGKMGAAILATRACLRAGVGLVTVHVPICGYEVMQVAVPEAMVTLDDDRYVFTRVYDLNKYSTIAIGCGLSTKNKTRNALCYLLKNTDQPSVLDADALNILAQSPDWWEYIPKNSILTPHPKEFERMFGRTYNGFERYELLKAKAQELGVYIILKGANSCIATPDGLCYFNSTGNPGMGTAGSGDVLTGILTGLLAQEYSPLEACILGVYVHGLAGDLAAAEKSQEGLMAGDLIDYLGNAFLTLRPRDKKIHQSTEVQKPIV